MHATHPRVRLKAKTFLPACAPTRFVPPLHLSLRFPLFFSSVPLLLLHFLAAVCVAHPSPPPPADPRQSLFCAVSCFGWPSNHCFNHPRAPLLQDGSCNGLQHYAALGRDIIGATSVNLMPCEVPQDVYSGVAQQVSRAGLFFSPLAVFSPLVFCRVSGLPRLRLSPKL